MLGVGGSGIVYELLHKTNGGRFAMKEMEIKNKKQMQMVRTYAGSRISHAFFTLLLCLSSSSPPLLSIFSLPPFILLSLGRV